MMKRISRHVKGLPDIVVYDQPTATSVYTVALVPLRFTHVGPHMGFWPELLELPCSFSLARFFQLSESVVKSGLQAWEPGPSSLGLPLPALVMGC